MSSNVLAWSCTACDRIFLKEELANQHSLLCKGKRDETLALFATITHDGPGDKPQCVAKKREEPEPFEKLGSEPQEEKASIANQVEPISDDVTTSTKASRPIKRSNTKKTSVKSKGYKCVRCSLDFKTWWNYKKHSKSEYHKNINRQFPCPFCVNNVGFPSAKVLRKHISQHHTKTICIFCEKICNGERVLHAHVKQKHLPNKGGRAAAMVTRGASSLSVAKTCGVGNVVASQGLNSGSQSDANVKSVPMETDQIKVEVIGPRDQNTSEMQVVESRAESAAGSRNIAESSSPSPDVMNSSLKADTANDSANSGIGDRDNGIQRLAALGLTPVASTSAASLKTGTSSKTGKSSKSGTSSNTGTSSKTGSASKTGKGNGKPDKNCSILEDDMPLNVFMSKVYKPGWDKWWWNRNQNNILSWEKKTRHGGQRSQINYANLNRGVVDEKLKGRERSRKAEAERVSPRRSVKEKVKAKDEKKTELGKKRSGGNDLRGFTLVARPPRLRERRIADKPANVKIVGSIKGSEAKRRKKISPKSQSVSSDGGSNDVGDIPDDSDDSYTADRPVARKRPELDSQFSACPVCDKVCRKEALAQHHKAHFKGKKWKCVHCEISIHCDFLSHLGKHLEEARHGTRHFRCQKCGFLSDNVAIYELHMRDHVLSSQFCATCQTTVTGDYLAHVKEHRLRNSATLWKCQTCNDSFKNSNVLEKHLLTHTGLQRELYACPLCAMSFDKMTAYSDHMGRHADRITVHICLLCDTTCFSEEELIRHVKTHVAQDKMCGDCGVVFPCGDKSAIAEHDCKLHGVSLICNECGATLPCGDDDAISKHRCVLNR